MRLGVDIVHVPRIKRLMSKFGHKFLDLLGTESTDSRHVAGRWASGEALYKALRPTCTLRGFLRQLSWQGRPPEAFLNGEPLKANVSISHDRDYAIAVVLIEE